ncbi:hypothetical protein OCHUTO_1117 [Orientia chuto str. Dubai]|uniref:Uncharacterized protein n=1 Tax=Orientia chuto str. Dubai TaxID=1359168 RepID=A0A0F3MFV6_9RICK|nr:hypothetical protein [Candidatus Orientia mediorientalis]KJV54610.1 hypothetical protein OCHUTO_1117 [Orientia chuto str. Dubai]
MTTKQRRLEVFVNDTELGMPETKVALINKEFQKTCILKKRLHLGLE